MSAGNGGFSGSAAAKGPVAGFDPKLDFRKKNLESYLNHIVMQYEMKG